MDIRNKKLIIAGLGIIVALVIVGIVGALNGWFGGGPKIPEDTFTRGLVAYWSFDEGTGNIAYDISGNGNNGTIYGAKWTKGKYGSALQFDGVDDYVEILDDDSLDINIQNGEKITIEAWIYPYTVTGERGIVSKRENYRLLLLGQSIKFQTFGWTASQNLKVTANKWHHVVVTYDGTTKELNFYLDGSRETRENYSVNGGINPWKLYIGKGHDFSYFFHGIIDEVRIYNRALSAEEIRYHYNRGRPIAHWRFDEGSGTTTYDSSGNEYHGILHE